MTREARILVAMGADPTSSEAVRGALEGSHHRVRLCDGAAAVPQQMMAFRPDLVVMDLPVGDRRLLAAVVQRVHASYRPLLLGVLSDSQRQLVPALDAGVDACIERPFTAAELTAHIGALLRRAPWLERPVHQVGALVVDESAHIALYRDEQVALSAKDFQLLSMLVRHAGTVLSKRALLERIWGFDAFDENLVEVRVSALRRRLPNGAGRMIQTVRGVGYVLRDELVPVPSAPCR